MTISRFLIASLTSTSLLLSSCGGGGSGGSSGSSAAPTPSASGTCSLRNRQNFALATLNEWYLFPETLPASLDPAPFTNIDDYVDALTATARSQGRDRFFTYITSIAEENAFFDSGTSAGFGIRLSTDVAARRVTVAEAFENAPALAAGIDRGTEIVAIGTSAANARTVSEIIAAEGEAGVTNALGPSTAGTTRFLRLAGIGGAREVTVAKANYDLVPVSGRYGSRIIDDGGRRVGYLNLRTFISSADPQLRNAFADFRAQGVTEFVIDFRYNGGGLLSTAELLGDLLGRNRGASEVFAETRYRPEKASRNTTKRFDAQPQSVAPLKIAFIGTGATASASELVINGLVPYLGANLALIGSNTFGKPVGQIAIDREACDDRVRVVAFSTRNAAGSDAYFGGLAPAVGASCQAADDLSRPLGDPQEASLRQSLDYLAGRSCTPIGATAGTKRPNAIGATRALLTPAAPSAAQREVPGLF